MLLLSAFGQGVVEVQMGSIKDEEQKRRQDEEVRY